MAYTEIKMRGEKKYYYRVVSKRIGNKVSKKRIYLGVGLSKTDLSKKEKKADIELDKLKAKNISRNKNQLDLKKNKMKFKKIIPEIRKILISHNIKKADLFGSFVLGKQNKKSDLDILILPPKGIGFELARIKLELEKKMQRKVDLVSYNGINPYIKEEILKNKIKII